LIVPLFHGHKRILLTSFAKDNSVPGSKQTATYLFSGAEKLAASLILCRG
jgi:hypothetical protein